MPENKDQFLIWVISGIIGILARDLYGVIAKLIGIAKFFIWNIAASIFLEPNQIHTFLGTILGLLADFVTAGFIGVIFGLFVEWRGTKYCLLKGWGLGLLAWLFLFGIMYHTLPHTQAIAPKDALSNISAFIGHSIFGLSMAFAYLKLAKIGPKRW